MTWTTTRPTQPGWYWVRWPESPQAGPEILEVTLGGLDTDLCLGPWHDPIDEYIEEQGPVEWQGPLKPAERDERETQP